MCSEYFAITYISAGAISIDRQQSFCKFGHCPQQCKKAIEVYTTRGKLNRTPVMKRMHAEKKGTRIGGLSNISTAASEVEHHQEIVSDEATCSTVVADKTPNAKRLANCSAPTILSRIRRRELQAAETPMAQTKEAALLKQSSTSNASKSKNRGHNSMD